MPVRLNRPSLPAPGSRRRNLAALLLGLGTPLLTGCQAAFFGSLNIAAGHPADVAQQTVQFEPAEQLSLDIYQPRGVTNAPVVIFFYGGSWMSGKRQWYRWVGQALAKQGLLVVIPDYRKWPQVRMAGFLQDAARAVAWTHAHAADYGGDPHELFLMGHSAGGHIAAMLATDKEWLDAVNMKPRDLAGFIGIAGPYDFLPLTDEHFIDMFGQSPAAQRRSQPVNFVDGDEPPMLLLQGTGDKVVGVKNAKSLDRAMKSRDESSQMILYPGVGHAGILLGLSPSLNKKTPVQADALAFIHEHVALRRVKANATP